LASANPLSIEELAAQIKADEAYVRTHPDTLTEAEKAHHTAEMLADMKRREAEVEADYAAQRAYYKKFADAEAAKWRNPKAPTPDSMTVYSNGSWSKTYNSH
jgi:hypothetical protein